MTLSPASRAWLWDTTERVGSTLAEAGLAYLTTKLASLPAVYMLAFTPALAALKAQVAKLVPGSVSPASLAPAPKPEPPSPSRELKFSARYDIYNRLGTLPVSGRRKGGALPSPRDDRDYQAKLPRAIPSSVDYGKGITWRMLLNDRLGDCYEAALLHALQVLTGYEPKDADALAIYEQVTGYDPTKTRPDGSNPTDRGTAGRPLFDWARHEKLISSYAAVPPTRASVKAAIAGHKAVLCEWALPVGAETEGDVWTVPRASKQAGSWGYHATVYVGYTSRRNKNVTWGEEGTVTPPFEDAYLQAAWVVDTDLTAEQVAAIMARVRAR